MKLSAVEDLREAKLLRPGDSLFRRRHFEFEMERGRELQHLAPAFGKVRGADGVSRTTSAMSEQHNYTRSTKLRNDMRTGPDCEPSLSWRRSRDASRWSARMR